MGIVQMILRVLTVAIAVLGVSSFSFMVLTWLNVENGRFLALWFTGGPFLIVAMTYLLYAEKIPKEHQKKVRPKLVPGVLVALGVAALLGYTNYVSAADLPEWLRNSLPAFSLTIGFALARELQLLDYTARRERGTLV